MSTAKLRMREWAAELSPEHKALTREDAMLLALIATNDRLVEIQGAIEDLRGRYHMLDLWMEANVNGYRAPEHRKVLLASQDGGTDA